MIKRLILLILGLFVFKGTVLAWSAANYPPDNIYVQFTTTNLPIVWIEVNNQTIDRENRITARMKIIHNGDGRLNYADTILRPNQHIDYQGYIALRYRATRSAHSMDRLKAAGTNKKWKSWAWVRITTGRSLHPTPTKA